MTLENSKEITKCYLFLITNKSRQLFQRGVLIYTTEKQNRCLSPLIPWVKNSGGLVFFEVRGDIVINLKHLIMLIQTIAILLLIIFA